MEEILMKSNAKAILILVMVFLLVLPGSAAAGDGIQVELNGEKLLFDVPPAMVSGRVLVPLRAVFEALDVVPEWDPETQTVEASSGEKIIRLSIGSRQAMVGGGSGGIGCARSADPGKNPGAHPFHSRKPGSRSELEFCLVQGGNIEKDGGSGGRSV